MDEKPESLGLLHSIDKKVKGFFNDSGSVFSRVINVTLKGWHEEKSAMKGKGSSEGLINSSEFLTRELHLRRDGIQGVGKGGWI